MRCYCWYYYYQSSDWGSGRNLGPVAVAADDPAGYYAASPDWAPVVAVAAAVAEPIAGCCPVVASTADPHPQCRCSEGGLVLKNGPWIPMPRMMTDRWQENSPHARPTGRCYHQWALMPTVTKRSSAGMDHCRRSRSHHYHHRRWNKECHSSCNTGRCPIDPETSAAVAAAAAFVAVACSGSFL